MLNEYNSPFAKCTDLKWTVFKFYVKVIKSLIDEQYIVKYSSSILSKIQRFILI